MDATLIAVIGMFAAPWTIAGLIHPRAAGMRSASRWKILGIGSLVLVLMLIVSGLAATPQGGEPQPASGAALALAALLLISFVAWPLTALVMRTKDRAKAQEQQPQAAVTPPAKPLTVEKPQLLTTEQRKALDLQEREPSEPARQAVEQPRPAVLTATVTTTADDDRFAHLCPESVDERTVSFLYKNGQGEISDRTVDVAQVGTSHFAGFCHRELDERTFRFDRIIGVATLTDTSAKVLPDELRDLLRGYDEQELRRRKRAAAKTGHEILFTGFKKERRAELEDIAQNAGMVVRKNVTNNLDFLCAGSNAGPTKLAEARERGVMVLDEQQFVRMLETGEVSA